MEQKKILSGRKAAAGSLVVVTILLLLPVWNVDQHRRLLVWSLVSLFWLSFWGSSVKRRVIHTRVRRYLMLVAFMMAGWIVIRTLKWEYVYDLNVARYLWYLYYIPLLFIPFLSLLVAVALGKPEDNRLPVLFRLLFGINGLLFLMVLTNDLHQQVFSFPADAVIWSDYDYSYEIGFLIITIWTMGCGTAALLVMLRKARALRSRTILLIPILSMGSLLLYVVCYALDFVPPIYPIKDMVLVFCILIPVTLEGCIQSGLIQSNTRYMELFRLSTIDGQIADRQFRVQMTSGDTAPLSPETVRRAAEASQEAAEVSFVMEVSREAASHVAEAPRGVEMSPTAGENIRLLCAPLKNGYVLWKEDISEIAEILAELADESEYLTSRKTVLQKEVDTNRQERMLIERNRLYNTLMDETKEEIDSFALLLDQIEESSDPEEIKRLTKRQALLCTHIKRRSNLLLLAEENQRIEACELQYALEEWLSNLKLGGVICNSLFDMKKTLALSEMLFFYDAIQRVLLDVLDNVKSVFVNCFERDGTPCLLMNLTCEGDFGVAAFPGVTVSEEDGDEIVLEIVPPKQRTGESKTVSEPESGNVSEPFMAGGDRV